MLKIKPKIIIITGPTASGKSGMAILLSKKFNGEIISADSRQVFRGMDIGTGKVSEDQKSRQLSVISDKIQDTRYKIQKNFNNKKSKLEPGNSKNNSDFYSDSIRHYLIDVVDPMEDFNVSHFKIETEKAIKEILAKGKVPIICGGTNFWISAFIENINLPEVKPDLKLRKELEEKSAEELFKKLKSIDTGRAENIDSKNKVRLIRAIEIVKTLGIVPKLQTENCKLDANYDFLEIGIDVPRDVLNEKIKKRLTERFDEGMINEVKNLNNPPAGGGVSFEWMEKIGLEYRWISRFLQNKISENEMKEKLYFDIIHYAKRQMTWLKRNERIIWLKDYLAIEKSVLKFLEK